jgi:hypothetical protein
VRDFAGRLLGTSTGALKCDSKNSGKIAISYTIVVNGSSFVI